MAIFAGAAFTACETDPEKLEIVKPYEKSDEYYANLRAYKKSPHEVFFGWFGGWNPAAASAGKRLASLPDSVDMLSIWGAWHPSTITPEKRADLEFVQKVKGTKVMGCAFTANVGDGFTPPGEDQKTFWGWDATDATKQEAAIRKYATAIADSIIKAGLDGFDMDHEPNYGAPGNLASYPARLHIFFDELSKYFGPKSGTGRLLCVDGEPQSLDSRTGELLDYFIVQSYNSRGYTDLDSRFSRLCRTYPDTDVAELAAKYIVTETIEGPTSFPNGGVTFTQRDGTTTPSMLGMAGWKPLVNGEPVRKGGCGSYHMENDYRNANVYTYTIQCIRIMNPAKNNN